MDAPGYTVLDPNFPLNINHRLFNPHTPHQDMYYAGEVKLVEVQGRR
jgi:hypothetical protein